MELNDEFEVSVPVAEAWVVLTDVEKIAPCLPGIWLRQVEGDEYQGVVKVKVGPVTVSYGGSARFELLDADAHKAVLKAEGRELRGHANATALVKAALSPSAKGTRVQIVTDLNIAGKLAQFSGEVLAGVSRKLIAEFVDNLESTVLAVSEATTPEPVVETPAEAEIDAEAASYEAEIDAEVAFDEAEAAGEAASAQADSDHAAGDRWISSPPLEESDHLIAKRESFMRRLTPYLTVAGILLIARIVVYSLRRRRR
jgi:carbon monoxide dehydrogenase subunit G